MKIEAKDLQPIADLINLIYSGNPKGLVDDLYLNIYLLHYLNPDSVRNEEVEWVAYLLKSLSDSFQAILDD